MSHWSILLSATALLFITSNLNWYGESWKDFQESDAKGYYAYLPAVFVYEDLNFGFFDYIEKEKYYIGHPAYDYRELHNHKYINKYYCGTALVCSPFFVIAHFVSPFFGFEQDGYSYLYMVFQTIAALFYVILGLFFMRGLLRQFSISESIISIVLVSFLFGSNLFYYTVGELGMSHVYSFAWVSAFLYYSKRHIESSKTSHLFLLSMSLGLIVLIRPVNGLVLFFLPFLTKDFRQFKDWIIKAFHNYKSLGLALLLFSSIVSIQLLIYKIQTGSFLVYSYKEEGFNFLSPEIFNFLFSYQKGLFVYTPIFFVAMLGLIAIFKINRFRFYMVLGAFSILIYVFSSWWCWFYGGSFSSRVMVEFIPVFGLVLGTALQQSSRKLGATIISILTVLIIVCQIQTFQYRYYEIHWSEMTKERYWDVFLRVDKLIEKTKRPQ